MSDCLIRTAKTSMGDGSYAHDVCVSTEGDHGIYEIEFACVDENAAAAFRAGLERLVAEYTITDMKPRD